MVKKNLHVILLILLITPLLFININDHHDWGGDFAQYLNQTKNFLSSTVEIEPVISTSQDICPYQRGSGFSLLLSLSYYFFGHNIKSLITLISIFYILVGVISYYFFRANFSQINSKNISIILVLNILYNYHFLRLKMEIMPVFPFMLILYSIFLIYFHLKKSFFSFFLISILVGLLVSIKNIGWCLYLAILFHLFISTTKSYELKKLKQLLILISIPIATLVSIKWLVFGDASFQNEMWHNSVFSFGNLKTIIFNNLQSYLNTIKIYFEQEIWGWTNILIRDSILILFLIGLVKKWSSKIEITDTFFILYMSVLLIFPSDKATFRYLTPLLPIILIYVTIGIKSIKLKVKKNYLISLFFTLLLVSNYINVKNIIINGDKYIVGPENKKANEVFQYIKNTIPNNLTIAFTKPWVLYYYTGKKSLDINLKGEIKGFEIKLTKHKPNYILLCSDSTQYAIYNFEMLDYISNNINYKKIWKNEQFILFEYKTTSNTL